MGRIEELIEIVGADKAEAELARVANAQQRVGDSAREASGPVNVIGDSVGSQAPKVDRAAESFARVASAQRQAGDAAQDAGRKVEESGEDFDALNPVLMGVANSARGMIAGFLGFQTVLQQAREYLAILQQIRKLQEEMADAAIKYAGDIQLLAASLRITEEQAAELLHTLQRASGMSRSAAVQFGIAANVAFGPTGGLMAGQNTATAEDVAAYAGAQGLQGDQAAQLIRFLAAAGRLGSPEDAKTAMAQIGEAAKAGGATNLGAFVEQLTRGGTKMLMEGATLEDVLLLAAQARQQEGSEEKAAGAMRRAAGGGEQGEGVTARGVASGAQRARATAKGAATDAAIRGGTAADADAAVQARDQDVATQAAKTQADIEYQEYVAGREDVAFRLAQKRATQRVREKIKSGEIGTLEQLMYGDEALMESEIVNALVAEYEAQSKRAGTPQDATRLEEIKTRARENWNRWFGYSDDVVRELSDAVRELSRRPTVYVNTQNVAVEPGRQNVPPVPVHQ